MLCEYADIISRLGQPAWWDEVGCPRYCNFHPSEVNDIYAREVALLHVACQRCGKKYRAALSWAHSAEWWPTRKHIRKTASNRRLCEFRKTPTLRERGREIHYGDPPCFECSSGATMSCIDLEILEFWERTKGVWVRTPEAELKGLDSPWEANDA